MSELSKRMREIINAATPGKWGYYHPSEFPNDWRIARYGDTRTHIDGLTYIGRLTVSHDPKISGNGGRGNESPTKNNVRALVESRNAVPALCEEIERLEAENADLRAKLAERYDPLSALDAACRASGLSLADDYEQRLAEWRAYVDSPVDPADLDSALYRAIADDPKSYPPEKP